MKSFRFYKTILSLIGFMGSLFVILDFNLIQKYGSYIMPNLPCCMLVHILIFGEFHVCMISLNLNLRLQVLASKSPDFLDFHEDFVSLESASKVLTCWVLLMVLKNCNCSYPDILFIQIQLKLLAEEQQAIVKGLEKVELELSASEEDGPVSEVFCKVSIVLYSSSTSFYCYNLRVDFPF